MPAFPSIDLTRLDVPRLDMSRLDLSNVDVKLPEIDTDRVMGFARDAAYVGIGFGVLAVQQAQVRRREVQATVERQIRQLVDAAR